jgi:hypothetical protein
MGPRKAGPGPPPAQIVGPDLTARNCSAFDTRETSPGISRFLFREHEQEIERADGLDRFAFVESTAVSAPV